MTASTSAPNRATALSRRAVRWAVRLGVAFAAVAAFTWWCGTAGAAEPQPSIPTSGLPAPAVPGSTSPASDGVAPTAEQIGSTIHDLTRSVVTSPVVQELVPAATQVVSGVEAASAPVTDPVTGAVDELVRPLAGSLAPVVDPVVDPVLGSLAPVVPAAVAALSPVPMAPHAVQPVVAPFGPLAPGTADAALDASTAMHWVGADQQATRAAPSARSGADLIAAGSDASTAPVHAPATGPFAPPAWPSPAAPSGAPPVAPRSSVSAGDHGAAADGYLSTASRHGDLDAHRLRATDVRWTSAPPGRPPVAPD